VTSKVGKKKILRARENAIKVDFVA